MGKGKKEEEPDETFNKEWEQQMAQVYEESMGRPDLFELEDWFPAIACYVFEDAQIRLRLHHKFNDKKIISLLNQYDRAINKAEKKTQSKGGDVNFPPSFPLFDLPEFGVLRLLRKANKLGKAKGRMLLMGEKNENDLLFAEKRRKQVREWSQKGLEQSRQENEEKMRELLPKCQDAIYMLHEKNPHLKWTPLTDRVAKGFDLSGKQLRRYPLQKPPTLSK
jgi:hypothetical protein